MKKIIAIVMAVSMLVGMLVLTSGAAPAVPAEVGRISEGRVLPEFQGKEQQLTNAFKAAYARAIELYASNLKEKFNPGQSTEEYVHDWVGDTYKCMAQDFTGGNSNCTEAFNQKAGWNVFVCPVNPKKPGVIEVFHVRDGIAQSWALNGGTNSNWGLPISNQYWGTYKGQLVVIQEFMNGYAYGPENSVFDITFVPYEEDPGFKRPADAQDEDPRAPKDSSNQQPGQTSSSVSDTSTDPIPSGGNESDVSNVESGEDPGTPTESGEQIDTSDDDTSGGTGGGTSKSTGTTSKTSGQQAGGTTEEVREFNLAGTIALVAGIVVVLAGGGFALYWFVLRKKPALAEGDAAAAGAVEETAEDTSEESSEDSSEE
ncbi:MAG TPA: hypothetical protein GXX17_01275 [Clostridiales bacterium]|nr:hypothetical protein [Clostridiales bacterium]